MSTYRNLSKIMVLLATSLLFITVAAAQDTKKDDLARVALARGDNEQALSIVQELRAELVKSGKDLSAVNAYRGALAADRLGKPADAATLLKYAMAADPSLSFASSADRVETFAKRLGFSATPVAVLAGLRSTAESSLPDTIVALQSTIDAKTKLLEQQQTKLQRYTAETHAAEVAAANAASDRETLRARFDIALTIAITSMVITLLVLAFFIGLMFRRRRAAIRIAARIDPPQPQSFTDLISRLSGDTNLVLTLLRGQERTQSPLFLAMAIAQPQLANYMASVDYKGATFVIPPPEELTHSIAGSSSHHVVSSLIDSASRAA